MHKLFPLCSFFKKVWEDAFESFSKMSQDIIVQVWKDWGLSLKNQIEKVKHWKSTSNLFCILDLCEKIF